MNVNKNASVFANELIKFFFFKCINYYPNLFGDFKRQTLFT